MTGVVAILGALGGIVVRLTNATLEDSEFEATAQCGIKLARAGGVTYTGDSSDADPTNEWAEPASATVGDSYECRLTVVSGDAPSSGPTPGDWVALSSDREWLWTQLVPGELDGTVDIDIGFAGLNTAMVTARYTALAAYSE